jgi:hypothetical protein
MRLDKGLSLQDLAKLTSIRKFPWRQKCAKGVTRPENKWYRAQRETFFYIHLNKTMADVVSLSIFIADINCNYRDH